MGFTRVLPGFRWDLAGFTGFYWVLPGLTGSHRVWRLGALVLPVGFLDENMRRTLLGKMLISVEKCGKNGSLQSVVPRPVVTSKKKGLSKALASHSERSFLRELCTKQDL